MPVVAAKLTPPPSQFHTLSSSRTTRTRAWREIQLFCQFDTLYCVSQSISSACPRFGKVVDVRKGRLALSLPK